MRRCDWFYLLHRGLLALALLCAGAATGAQAQSLTVATITVDGQPAQSVSGVQVRLPGATSGQAQTLKTGEAIPPGAELTLPRGARVELTSSNGNTITLHPGARFLTGVVTAKGESHLPLEGRIDFQVRKALDFFNVQYERITASVKGTDYSVEIDPAKSLTLSVNAGVIEVERPVKIKFAAAEGGATATDATTNQGDGIRVVEDLKAGQIRTYSLDVEEYLAEFRNFGEAETYFKKALATAEASGDKRRIVRALHNLMEMYRTIGKPGATLDLDDRCIDLVRGISNPADEAACLSYSARAYYSLGEYRKAIDYHEKSLAVRKRIFSGRDHPVLAQSLNDLGNGYRALGEYRRAIEYHERSLAMRERVYAGRDHSDMSASLNNLGFAYFSLGDYRKAIEYHEKSLAMRERVFAGRDHPDISASFNNLGIAYYELGEYRKAIDYQEKSLAMTERVFVGRDHPEIAGSFNNLGNAYYALDQYRKAIDYHEKSLAMRQRIFLGREHPAIAQSFNNLGNAYYSLGEYRKAIDYHVKSLAMRERIYPGRGHADIAESFNNLGVAYESLGEYHKAIEHYEKSLAMQERVFSGRDHPEIALSLRNLADAHQKAGNRVDAARYRARAASMTQRLKGK
jgi:tetratricopeptide (TPR) repeat protein